MVTLNVSHFRNRILVLLLVIHLFQFFNIVFVTRQTFEFSILFDIYHGFLLAANICQIMSSGSFLFLMAYMCPSIFFLVHFDSSSELNCEKNACACFSMVYSFVGGIFNFNQIIGVIGNSYDIQGIFFMFVGCVLCGYFLHGSTLLIESIKRRLNKIKAE